MYELTPEYGRMSLRPAIGKEWFGKYRNDVYAYDHVIVNGKRQKPPKYYDRVLRAEDSARAEEIAAKREQRARQIPREEKTWQRRAQRETCTQAAVAAKAKRKL